MKKSTKKALLVSGVAAIGICALATVYHATARYLVKLALDRKPPKAVERQKQKLMGSEEVSRLLESVTEAADKLQNAGCEEVTVTAHDGIKLVGHWFGGQDPKRVIVAMHGWRSGWSQDFGAISDFWHQNDCALLYAEQRGQGGSEGEYMGFGMLERYDCFEWIKWVNERTGGNLPIYLGGISMGATTVLMTAGFKLPENVKGIIADCGFTSPKDIFKHVVENNFHIPYGLYSTVADDLCKKRLQVKASDYSCADALKNSTVPVLFIHGTDDRFVPISMTFENYKACAAPKRLLTVVGAEHGMSYLIDKEAYEAAVKDFWQTYDG